MESFEIFITLNMGIQCCQQESKKQVPNIINVVNEPEKKKRKKKKSTKIDNMEYETQTVEKPTKEFTGIEYPTFDEITPDKPTNINDIKPTDTKIKKDKKNSFEPYDVVIDINSIKNLHDPGWQIIYNGYKEKLKNFLEYKNFRVVSVLGNSNRGKTFLLEKLSGNNLESGYQVQTKGLSLKIHKNLIYLDTAGTNIPLLIENNEERPNESELQNIQLCQIITNFLLQKFVIEYADILVCVIGMLNMKEQIFLNKIKKFCEDKKSLIVIHNLVKCNTCSDIEKYKKKTLLNMIGCPLEERVIPDFGDNKENLFNKYFLEKGPSHVKHFIFANDDKNKSKEIEKYNKTALNFIKTCIKMEAKKPKNLFKNFMKHISEKSSNVLKNKITPKIENDSIKCDEGEIIPREIKADELDNLIFIGKDYEPSYRFTKRGKYFVLEIQMCSKNYEISVIHKLDKSTKETVFYIEGKRLFDISDEKETLTNKRINFTNFKISPKVRLSDFGIKFIGKKEIHSEIKYGILFYIYEIIG